MEFFEGMIMPVTYPDGTNSRVFTCLSCLDKHDSQ